MIDMIERIALAVLPFSDRLLHMCFVALGGLIAIGIADLIFRKAVYPHAPTKRARTLLAVMLNVIKFIIFGIAVMLILSIWHVNITPILASAGIVGLAVGFGAQVLVKDIISGIFLIFENQFNTGDTVKIGEIEGVVERVGLRTISVRDSRGALHIVPNGSIDKLANLTSRWSSAVVAISVPTQNDIDRIIAILEDCAKQVAETDDYRDAMTKPPKVYALDDLDAGKMSFKVVIKTLPGKQEGAAQHFRYLVKKAFDKEKIAFS